MALTRKMLKAMSIEDEKIEQIIEAHAETVDGLKEKLSGMQDQSSRIKELESELEKAGATDDWKERYEQEHADFEAFKAEQAKKAEEEQKAQLYRKLLVDAGVDPKRIDRIMKVTDLSDITVKDGELEGKAELSKAIESEWADFIRTETTQGVQVKTPPQSSGKTMTKADIMAIKDTQERQRAISENIELFGGN